MIPLILNEDSVVTVVNGERYRVERNSLLYQKLIDAIKDESTEDEICELLKSDGMASYLEDADINCVDGKFELDGEEVHPTIINRIKAFADAGLPIKNLESFERRRRENVSFASSEEAFDFLQNKNMPVTEDGCFLAYKAVRTDYMDKYSGTIDNHPGQLVQMTRRKVDDDRDHGCSKGLHVGALEYAESYGGHDCIILLVKVDPKDIVSVPKDSRCQKCRVCEYRVLKVVRGPLERPLYSAYGEELDSYNDGEDDWDDEGFWEMEEEALDDEHDTVIYDHEDVDGVDDGEDDNWDDEDVVSWPIPPTS